jgi:hypothetical protein
MWADDQFIEHAGFNPGLDVDHLVDTTRFYRVWDVVLDFPTVDEINDELLAAAVVDAGLAGSGECDHMTLADYVHMDALLDEIGGAS